jgi:RimJ/RimL family protein N-acetyltransferase
MAGTGRPTPIAESLETARLYLRPPEEADLDGWAALWADEEATRFLGGRQSRGQAWRSMAAEAGSWRLKGYGMYSVLDKATGQWLGRVGPHWPEGYPGLEVGWALLPCQWGRGIAIEAAIAAIDAVFRGTGVDRIFHLIDPENVRSVNLASRLGSINTGSIALPDPYDKFTVDCWALGRDAWTRSKPSMDDAVGRVTR